MIKAMTLHSIKGIEYIKNPYIDRKRQFPIYIKIIHRETSFIVFVLKDFTTCGNIKNVQTAVAKYPITSVVQNIFA
ncbi:MAG: hypothetical protein WCP92_04310 [bacterium]